jgi:5-methylcytosine-specific restriction endonuclease McrA
MKPAMVLNADYQPMEFPITITSGQQAINRIIACSFRPINFHDDPILTKNEELLFKLLGFTHWPSVVVHQEYIHRRVADQENFTPEKLYIRDLGKCRYCGKELTQKQATWDHYIPTSKGGDNTWTNAVLACNPCNIRKDNKMPKGEWHLQRPPHEPTFAEMKSKARHFPLTIYDEAWLDYLPKWKGAITLAK